jgi:glucose-1-phosphate adenylyltransferase
MVGEVEGKHRKEWSMAKKDAYQSVTDTMKKVGAIVLGGGRGTRLFPLTELRAKPAVPLCGRYRLIDIPLSNCIHSGISKIVVLTQFNSHSLNRHIINSYKFDDFSQGYATVLAAEQTEQTRDWFQGTADAVRKQLQHIRDSGVEHFIILSGDQLYRMDYRDLMLTHLKKDADITVAALPVDRSDAKDFGVMRVHKNTRIREFVEKPSKKAVLDSLVTPESVFGGFGLQAKGKPFLASMGIYAFKAEVLEKLLLDNPDWVDFGKELLPNSLRSHKLYAHMFDGFWEDIGTVRSYFDISIAMTSENPPFKFHDPDRPIFTHTRPLPGAQILDAKITNSIICAGARVHSATLSDSIVGIRNIIHPGASLSQCVMLGADNYESDAQCRRKNSMGIGENTRISRAIVDRNARVGKNCVIRGSDKLRDADGKGFSVRDGIVIVHKNAVIAEGTKIG